MGNEETHGWDPSTGRRKWELRNEYRGRIRRYAWLVIVWVPVGFVALALQVGEDMLGYLAAGALAVQALIAGHIMIAINGAEAYRDGWSTEALDEERRSTGDRLGKVAAMVFVAIFILEASFLCLICGPLSFYVSALAGVLLLVVYCSVAPDERGEAGVESSVWGVLGGIAWGMLVLFLWWNTVTRISDEFSGMVAARSRKEAPAAPGAPAPPGAAERISGAAMLHRRIGPRGLPPLGDKSPEGDPKAGENPENP